MNDLLPDRPLNFGEFALATALGIIMPFAGALVCGVAGFMAYRAEQWWMLTGLTIAGILSVAEIFILISLL
jgi:hypothetical protein